MHNGQLLDENLLVMIEQLGGNDMNEMQKGMEALDTCTGIRMSKILLNDLMIPLYSKNKT
jgi:hypothetical protein